MRNPVVDVDEEEDGRVGPKTSPPPPGVAKACTTTTEPRRLLGDGAVAMTKRKAAAASIEGPGVMNDRERFPLLLPVEPAAVDIIYSR